MSGDPMFELVKQTSMILSATKMSAAATLAAAVVSKMDRHVSIGEVLGLQADFYFSLYPDINNAAYREWKKDIDSRLNKPVA